MKMTDSWKVGAHQYKHLPENEQETDSTSACIGKLLILAIFILSCIIAITGWGVMS